MNTTSNRTSLIYTNLHRRSFANLVARSNGFLCLNNRAFDSIYTREGSFTAFNWGSRRVCPNLNQDNVEVFNPPEVIGNASNKIRCQKILAESGVPCLIYSTDFGELRTIFPDRTIFARHNVSGHSGSGIEVITPDSDLSGAAAPLYTADFGPNNEYRVHSSAGKAIFVQQKKRMRESRRPSNTYFPDLIKTHSNGWVFAINDLHCDSDDYRDPLETLADMAIRAAGLDYGAVDIAVSTEDHSRMSVIEINTAPALRGSARQKWADEFTRLAAEVDRSTLND